MLKGLGDLTKMGGMLKQAMEVKQRIEAFRETLGDERIQGESGAGMVTVQMSGRFDVLAVHIDPELVSRDQVEALETLVQAAINSATEKTREMVKQKMTELTGGFEIPGLT